MNRNSFLKQILLGLGVTLFFASCDKDFNEIGANIIGDDHFGFEHYTATSIKAYNQKLGPIASHNLDLNALGIYDNPAFGKTVANFVTQLEMDTPNPTFTTINTPPVIESVILSIPYNSTLATALDADGNKVYTLNSIYGGALSKMKLGIYESGYYLRDLDPSEQLGTEQAFYTDQNAEIDSHKIGSKLNNSVNDVENDQFFFNPDEADEDAYDADGNFKTTKTAPAMRMHLDNAYFTAKILNAPSGQLYNNNIFKNYMRGLYFKVENAGASPGNMALLNFKKGKITVYYKQDKQIPATTTTPAHVDRIGKTFVLKMTGNTVSLLDNSNEVPGYVNAINSPNTSAGDETLYVKGGEGAMAVIDIFGSTDTYKYEVKKDGAGNVVNDVYGDPLYIRENTSNGVSDELDDLRYPLAPLKAGEPIPNPLIYSPKNRWMINEANLTFYVDKTKISDVTSIEPLRVFLYDLNNKTPLIDYYYDGTIDGTDSRKNKSVFGGIIVKETVAQGGRTKYKIKITNHLRNLIMKDSTNVRLGLSVTENINDVTMSKLKTPNTATDKAPKSSVLSPVGTVLYGTNANVTDANRLKLEIYYTKPD